MGRRGRLSLALAVLAFVAAGCQQEPRVGNLVPSASNDSAEDADARPSLNRVEAIVRRNIETDEWGAIDSISCRREPWGVWCVVKLTPEPGDRCERRVNVRVKGVRVVSATMPLRCYKLRS